jgi:hypothetical protein
MDDMIDQRSWQQGFGDGKAGRPAAALSALTHAGIDARSYIKGWAEGEAERRVSGWIKDGTAGAYLASTFTPRPSDTI